MRAIVILLALGALTAGCPAIRVYEGDKRPEGEVAVIRQCGRHYGARVEEIDGKTFDPVFNWANAFSNRYEVLPGVHTIGVSPTGDYSEAEGDSFGLEVGGTVLLRLWDGRRIEASVSWGESDAVGHFTFRTKPVDLQLQAEAGHVYEVSAAFKGLSLWIWISDRDSTQVVAGVRPGHVGWRR